MVAKVGRMVSFMANCSRGLIHSLSFGAEYSIEEHCISIFLCFHHHCTWIPFGTASSSVYVLFSWQMTTSLISTDHPDVPHAGVPAHCALIRWNDQSTFVSLVRFAPLRVGQVQNKMCSLGVEASQFEKKHSGDLSSLLFGTNQLFSHAPSPSWIKYTGV